MTPSTWGECPGCGATIGFPRVSLETVAGDPARNRCRACGTALVLSRLPAGSAPEPRTPATYDRCGLSDQERREAARILGIALGGVV